MGLVLGAGCDPPLEELFLHGGEGLLDDGGGITSSGSSEKTRARISRPSGSPGMIAPALIAASRLSIRRSALREALSAPWQRKQFSSGSAGCRG